MTPRTLFAIIIKILGIYLVIGSLTLIPQSIVTFYSFSHQVGYRDMGDVMQVLFFIIFATGIYILILRYCLFKTEWVIEKLHLDKGFTEDKLEINIHRSTVLKIAVIVIGAIIIIENLPQFCRQVLSYYQMSAPDRGFKENPVSSDIIFNFAKLMIGFFLMTSSRLVVNFIERKRRGPDTLQQTVE